MTFPYTFNTGKNGEYDWNEEWNMNLVNVIVLLPLLDILPLNLGLANICLWNYIQILKRVGPVLSVRKPL